MNRFTKRHLRTLLTLLVGILALAGFVMSQTPEARAAMVNRVLMSPSIPTTFNYQGYLRNPDGTLVTGTTNVTVKIYDAATGGTTYFTESFQNVNVRDGLFNVVLGDNGVPLGNTFDFAPRFIGIALNGGSEITPRERVHGVPWAIHATHAASADYAVDSTNAVATERLMNRSGERYLANNYGSSSSLTVNLTNWQSRPSGEMCFLTTVTSTGDNHPSCTIDPTVKTLTASGRSYCEVMCYTFGN